MANSLYYLQNSGLLYLKGVTTFFVPTDSTLVLPQEISEIDAAFRTISE